MADRNVLLHISLAVVLVAVAICSGYLLRYHYESTQGDNADTSVYEVVAENGIVYNALPVQPSDAAAMARMRQVLTQEKIKNRVADGKLMVKPEELALSMDLLSAANLVRGTQHFTLSDVSADPEKHPRRFAAQNRLAIQNTLSKMIPLMSAEIHRASVLIESADVKVTLWLKSGNSLGSALRKNISTNVAEMVEGSSKVHIEFLTPDGRTL